MALGILYTRPVRVIRFRVYRSKTKFRFPQMQVPVLEVMIVLGGGVYHGYPCLWKLSQALLGCGGIQKGNCLGIERTNEGFCLPETTTQ